MSTTNKIGLLIFIMGGVFTPTNDIGDVVQLIFMTVGGILFLLDAPKEAE